MCFRDSIYPTKIEYVRTCEAVIPFRLPIKSFLTRFKMVVFPVPGESVYLPATKYRHIQQMLLWWMKKHVMCDHYYRKTDAIFSMYRVT